MEGQKLNIAEDLMQKFGDQTGLTSAKEPRRYLWTDAYAVCNYVALSEHSSESGRRADTSYLEHAIMLVEQVHTVLGRHRADDSREGWISGLDEAIGSQYPTAGGLRIGKPLPERGEQEPYDDQSEWDRDGQYFHYLTKWMHALHQLAKATTDDRYERWAGELAEAAFRGFKRPTSPARLVWKMSIDLKYPLVPSSGHHDPLDGLVTVLVLLQNGIQSGMQSRIDDSLQICADDLASMCRGRDWTTDDPLGLGGLLFDACRLAQLPLIKDVQVLLNSTLDATVSGLAQFTRGHTLQRPASHRLGFRELGLSIGLRGIDLLTKRLQSDYAQLDSLISFKPLADHIEHFWLTPTHQRLTSWTDHADINEVMLATSLLSPAVLETTTVHKPD